MKWIAGSLLLLLIGVLLRLGLLVYAMYVLLGAILIGRWFTRRWVEAIQVERWGSVTEAALGDTATVRVTIRNPTRSRVVWLLVEDAVPREALTEVPPALRVKGPRLLLTRLRAGEEVQLEYTVEFLRRGYYQFGPALVESGDLFGLYRRFRVVTDPHYVEVPPKVVPLAGYDLASTRPVGEVRLVHRLFEDPTRLVGVRQYARGDPLHRIHWRATARTGSLQSKTYEPSCVMGVTLVVDFHEASLAGNGRLQRAELTACSAASLAHAVQVRGQPLGFLSNGRDAADRIRAEGWGGEFTTRSVAARQATTLKPSDRLRPVLIETERRTDQFARVLATLARLEPTDGLSLAELLVEAGARIPRNSTLVAILPRVTDAAAVALASFRRRGHAVTVVLVVFDEAQTPEWAQGPDWAGWLIAAGVDVRRVSDEAALGRLCAEQFLTAR